MAASSEPSSFGQQIQAAQDRFGHLQDQLHQFSCPENDIAVHLAEELSIALVELHVAAEEIQEQHDYLVEARDALELERQRYQDLFEFAPYGYLMTDTAGHIQEANQAVMRLLDLPRDRLSNKLLVLFIPIEDRKVFRFKLNHIQTTRQSFKDLECHVQQPDGTRIPCELSASPIFHPQGYAVGFRWLIRDISERRQIAEMETASRIKDEFLAIVSHELRSPLNPILGWATLLRNGKVDPAKTVYALEVIERNAKLQAQLIEDLLDVSRILRGKLSLNPFPVNLVTTLRAAVETMQLAADAKRISVRLIIEPGEPEPSACENQPNERSSALFPPKVLGDAGRLQQVLWNLLSNAIKFTPEGGQVEVKLSLVTMQISSGDDPEHRNPQLPNQAQITVSDNGRGISADFLPHVFEYFRQADGSTTRQFSGLGLGLAIVRHIVELHGGTVQAESAGEDQGATFTIRLPLLQANNS